MYKTIFENAPVALLLVDQKGCIQLLNKEAENLFGYSVSELQGAQIETLIPASSRLKHPALMAGFFRNPQPRKMGPGLELFGARKDGSAFPVEVGLKPISTPEGLFVMSSVVDITARIKAEEKFKAAFEAAPNAMIMVDQKGFIVLVNEQTEQLFGYKKTELLGEPIEVLVPEETKSRHPAFIKSFVARPTPRPMGNGRDLNARRKDGSRFPVEIGLRPFQAAEGLYVISSIVDISDRVRAHEKVMERTEELEQFSYRTSHDLKTPLISINGLAELIVEDIKDGSLPEAAVNAQKILGLSTKLRSLIEDILALTKSDYTKEEQQNVDLEGICKSCVEKNEISAKDNEVAISWELEHKVPLFSQKTRITQIIDNLVSNAVKYCDAVNPSRYVKIKTTNDEGTFFIEVSDNGIGIPLAKQQEVFGIFKRFHAETNYGSGLGLYLVKRHVQKLGGQISFLSSAKGSTFTVKLPL